MAPCSLVAILEAVIRDSSRPGSQALHAPPALTFGLPGKQTVNEFGLERVLINAMSTLPQTRLHFSNSARVPSGRVRRVPARPALTTNAAAGELDLVIEEVGKRDALCFQGLRVQ